MHSALRKAILPLLCAVLALLSVWVQPVALQVLRNVQFDQFQRWHPRDYADVGVVVVDLDDESLRTYGQWPWPRTRVAELVQRLRAMGAVVIGLDALFVEPDRTSPQRASAQWAISPEMRQALRQLPDHDQVLARALQAGGTVVGMALEQGDGTGPGGLQPLPDVVPYRVLTLGDSAAGRLHRFDGARLPLPAIRAASAGLGSLNFVADPDGVVRRVPMLFAVQQQLAPTLVAEMLRVAQGASNYMLKGAGHDGAGLQEVRIGAFTIPTTAEGEMWLHYSAPQSERFEPAWRVLAGKTEPGRIAGKLVLVGTSAQGLMDLRFSPLGHVMPGVTAHAQALEQVLGGQALQRPSWAMGLEALVVVLGCLAVGFAAASTRAAVSATWAFLAVVVVVGGAWWAFVQYRLLLNGLEPALWMVLAFLLCSVQRHLDTEREERWIRQAFSRYVSPNRVDHLVAHPEQLELGGKRQECSFVFTDLAGFTTLMESMDPGGAVALLNDYLDRMIAIAFAHGATLDRFVGDAVAVVFSAPLVQPDHRQRAVQCALEMSAFAQAYAQRIQTERQVPFGYTRIGVHSGEVIVGNFGGSTMFDYRALGDPVNTASRLEGANKYLGSLVCISEATLSACTDVPARPVAHLVLKGKTQALAVWEPCAAQLPGCAPLEDYGAAYARLESNDPQALQTFEALAARYPQDGVVAMHLQRLQRGETGVQLVLHDK
ncbi:adenylate/guanylate cyclase domain-containing protein [Curvibacter sp. APW13]|uniref:CHASE2 domain-containing protein n=1 Tax=Curvibacter sp. APW13 TaxID=3077236 RepID=UPI0028DEA764|nr:adenylate/guanylate cyclase domain-containing protein [Curvibacter sp. APW13]MDT8989455.1 adenylate/guanylate cyclase domain-containing protein [Curvibacter sp. APW13]